MIIKLKNFKNRKFSKKFNEWIECTKNGLQNSIMILLIINYEF